MGLQKDEYRFLIEEMPNPWALQKIILDSNGDPVDFVFQDANQAFLSLTGFSRAELIGERASAILPGTSLAQLFRPQKYGEIALNLGEAEFEDFLYELGRWFKVSVFSREKGFFSILITDIIDYKNKKEALGFLSIYTEELLGLPFADFDFKLLTDRFLEISNSQAVLLRTREKGSECLITRSWSGDREWIEKAEEIIGEKFWKLDQNMVSHGSTANKLIELEDLQNFRGEKLIPGQMEKRKNELGIGSVFKINLVHLEENLGDFILFARTGDDIENRRAVELFAKLSGIALARFSREKRIRDSEKYHRSIIEVIPDIIARFGLDGTCLDLISGFDEKRAFSTEELTGKEITQMIPEGAGERFYSCIKRTLLTKSLQFVEYKLERPKGELWLEGRMVPSGEEEVLALIRDITENKKAREKLRYISFHDPLTNLRNRVFLEEEMERLDTERQLPISIIMLDINGLKFVNDSFGHKEGDQLIKRAANIISSCCRKEDIVARFGGDEFVLLLPQTPEFEAEKIHKRILSRCEQTKEDRISVSLSLGVAAKGNPGESLKEVLNLAEDRMYKNKLFKSKSSRGVLISILLKTLGEKSHETEEHTQRLNWLAQKVGEKIGLPPSELDRLLLLISLHDIGKINIPETILCKPSELNELEWEFVKKHPETGYRIARSTAEFSHVASEILAHHEWWDGTGYPKGLKGEQIPLLSRIAAVVDAFDVMTNYRPYKKTLSTREAREELNRCAGTQFDPEIMEVLVKIIREEQRPSEGEQV